MKKVIVAASTHWDREWYRTFQDFQIRLCDLFNQLLDLLEQDTTFLCYSFDGQSIVLEDYLEIYPENRQRIERLVREGRLLFGPLYNLPDEFLSGGEGLIRNFLTGARICRDIGGRLSAGYVPDNFGHISQLPQILRKTGIDNVFFFRGTNIDSPGAKEFYWEGPDGSRVQGEYLLLGYWSLKSWGKLGKSVKEHFCSALETLGKHSRLDTYLLINGSDHLYQDPDFTAMLREVQEAFPEMEIRGGSFADYGDLARGAAQEAMLPVIHGELRDFRYGPDPNAVLSCRSQLKRLSWKAFAELERYAEPLSVLMDCTGRIAYPEGFLNKAWKKQLTAMGHDGISGCSVDAVMEDITTYIRHSLQISDRVSSLALEKLGGMGHSTAQPEQTLLLFNPHPWEWNGVTEQTIHVEGAPGAWRDLELTEEDGTPVAYERIAVYPDIITREFPYNSKEKIFRTCFRIRFMAKWIPGMGIKRLRVRASALLEVRRTEQWIRSQNSIPEIENEYYCIHVNEDGSIDVLDKERRQWYGGLNQFISRGDVGDEYQQVTPLNDLHTFARLKKVAVRNCSELASTLHLKAVLWVPEKMNEDFATRRREEVPCEIETEITLYKGSRRIAFHVEAENQASDHIVYARFPALFADEGSYSYVSFDEVERKTKIHPFDPALKSTQSFTQPLQKYAGVRGGEESLHLIAGGMYEYHTKPARKGQDLYLTLFRSVSYMFHGLPVSWQDGQESTTPIVEAEGAKELGRLTFDYAIVLNQKDVYREAEQYLYPLRGADGTADVELEDFLAEGLVRFDSEEIGFSALKKWEFGKGIALRIYNRTDRVSKTVLQTARDIQSCHIGNLLEEEAGPAAFGGRQISVVLEPREIRTLLIRWSECNEKYKGTSAVPVPGGI